MAFLNDNIFDQGLSWAQTNGTKIDICSAEPASFAAISGVSLGDKAGLAVGAPTDGDVDGRKVVVPAITDGTVTANGTPNFWALSNGTDTLVATGAISNSQAVTNGNPFTLDAINLTIRDAT